MRSHHIGRTAALLPLLLASAWAPAQQRDIRVGLLRNQPPDRVLVAGTQGALMIWVDGERSGEVAAKDAVRISLTDSGLTAKSLARTFTGKRSIVVRPAGRGLARVSTLVEPRAERICSGTLEFTRPGGSLLIVNETPIEEYVAGTVQSEAGANHDEEYYKLQAVSCRTYALTNGRRHQPEGFSVCDNTHCQVYKGRCTLAPVKEAVESTQDLVVVDADIHLIHATFHSNCGGETMNAEDLWSKSEPYLVSTVDTFCTHAPHATWRKSMPRSKWLGYLQRAYGLDLNDSSSVRAVTSFTPGCRSLYIDGASPLIPLEQVRAEMKFNSALFTIWSNGDEVVFDGRGFGHGVGLCQEGAMRMASLGIPYTDILHHYFAQVHLVNLTTVDFFRDEGF